MQKDMFRPGGGVAIALLVGLAAVFGFGLVIASQSYLGTSSATAADPQVASQPVAATSPVESSVPSATHPMAPPATATPTPRPQPLPSLLGAIGDSYSQAWSTSTADHGDHPQFSWVVGSSSNDGVSSLLERFRALGATPQVVDAATSGMRMKDAVRQANKVVSAAKKLKAGQTAYVTFELGTNDLCASPEPLTSASAFQTQLQNALAILRAGLPTGSRILILAVPNMPHFHDITQANPAAHAVLARTSIQSGCPPYLGNSNFMPFAVADGFLDQYNEALNSACNEIEVAEGAADRLHCTFNAGLLSESDFVIGDLSTYDYFHPSLSGQARMAADAWAADIWAAYIRP